MYLTHWGLNEMPFENTPDPKFFYHSPQHEEGLSRLRYVVDNRKGAAMLTGEFGCGKTVLAKTLFTELENKNYQIAFISNPQLKAVELLRSIARNLGTKNLPHKFSDMSADYFLEVIEEILVNNAKDGRETLVVIDEAHVITDTDVLEQLRLLLNFQLENRFLLTLILMGQPELQERVTKIKQLLQRIALSYHIGPLSEEEVTTYIGHRLNVAGMSKQIVGSGMNVAEMSKHILEPKALKVIQRMSGGIPRRINHICDLSLLISSTNNAKKINEQIVEEAVSSFKIG